MPGTAVFRCGSLEHQMTLSSRDVHLLDGKYFFEDGWTYRQLLGLDFIRGLSMPPKGVTLAAHGRIHLKLAFESLLVKLETQRDLITHSYSYVLSSQKKVTHGGATSGIRIRGLSACIDTRPAGYCDLTLMEVGPNGRGRVVEIIDMRVRQEIETDNQGTLKIRRRKAEVGWFTELPKLLQFLNSATDRQVEVRHLSPDE